MTFYFALGTFTYYVLGYFSKEDKLQRIRLDEKRSYPFELFKRKYIRYNCGKHTRHESPEIRDLTDAETRVSSRVANRGGGGGGGGETPISGTIRDDAVTRGQFVAGFCGYIEPATVVHQYKRNESHIFCDIRTGYVTCSKDESDRQDKRTFATTTGARHKENPRIHFYNNREYL